MYENLVERSSMTINQYFSKIFALMTLGIAVSAGCGYALVTVPVLNQLLEAFIMNRFGLLIVIGIQLALVVFLRSTIGKKNTAISFLLFILYAMTLAFTFAMVFLVFELNIIVQAFAGAGILFGCLAVIGFTTKVDITRFGTILFVGLIALVIFSLSNAFVFRSEGIDLVICYVGLLLFLALTAYDVQKLKHMYYAAQEQQLDLNGVIVWGALELFLDFVNIFLYILRILGRSRD